MKEQIIELPRIKDTRGNLSFLEEGEDFPFQIARAYWIYDVPGGQKRGSHAFKTQQEVIIALSGSFDIVLNDGKETRRYHLNRAYNALYVPSKMWRYLENFSTNSVCLVISSGKYDENEYIRNYKEFKEFLKAYTPYSTNNEIINPLKSTGYKLQDNDLVVNCNLIDLPIVKNRAGNITYVHNSIDIPFDIKRIFFVYDIPSGQTRGMHAHKSCHTLLISAGGSFDVEIDDAKNKRTVSLNRPMQGLHILPGVWAKQTNYSSGAICLVLASEKYQEEDYIRKYADFKSYYGNRD